MSRFKHQMNMARLRIRGMAAVTYVATLRAFGLNIRFDSQDGAICAQA
jgi:hypothetical protein